MRSDCSSCFNVNKCMSATSFTRDPRKYFLKIKGFREADTPEMKAGRERHEGVLRKYKTLTEYGIPNFFKDLIAGNEITLREVGMCVHPDTVVQTPYILKNIKFINNEEVLDYMGNTNNAILSKKMYNGKLYRIKIMGNYDYLKCTPEHRLFVIKTSKCKDNFKDGRFQICWGNCSNLHNICLKNAPFLEYNKEWIEARELKDNDVVAIPKLKLLKRQKKIPLFEKDSIELERILKYQKFLKIIKPCPNPKRDEKTGKFLKSKNSESSVAKELGHISSSYFRQIRSGKRKIRYMELPKKICITNDLMKFIGLFVAEGSINRGNNNISFAFSENETDLHNKTIYLIRKLFKVNKIRKRNRNSGTSISFTNKVVTKFLKKWCYVDEKFCRAYTKSFPKFYLNCNKKLIKTLIKAYWLGDGCFSENKYSFSTVSENLAYQLRQMLSLFGIYPFITKRNENNNIICGRTVKTRPLFTIQIGGEQARRFEAEILEMKKINSKFTFQRFFQDKDYFYIPITDIEITDYNGEVYDLTVENGESFIANNITVHNCSRFYALRGFMDQCRFKYDKKTHKFFVHITEFKTGFHKSYFLQLGAYALISSDPDAEIIYEQPMKRKPATKIVGARMYPRENLKLNVEVTLAFFNGKEYTQTWMINNKMTNWGHKRALVIQMRANNLRRFHKRGIYFVGEIPLCKSCKRDVHACGFWQDICSKSIYEEPSKCRQRYFGKRKVLVSAKPKIKVETQLTK